MRDSSGCLSVLIQYALVGLAQKYPKGCGLTFMILPVLVLIFALAQNAFTRPDGWMWLLFMLFLAGVGIFIFRQNPLDKLRTFVL